MSAGDEAPKRMARFFELLDEDKNGSLDKVELKRVPGTREVQTLGGPGRAGTKRFHVLYRDSKRLARSLDLEEIRRAFDRDLSMAVGAGARRRIFVHAGVVSFEDGAILIPGKSFSGKTTLVRALVSQGGAYYSDEFAVLDSRGRVFPWAEALSIRDPTKRQALRFSWAWADLEQPDGEYAVTNALEPDALGWAVGAHQTPVLVGVAVARAQPARPDAAEHRTGIAANDVGRVGTRPRVAG